MSGRPNVIVVLCDQLRRQALCCAGDPNVSTPHLDRLADEGIRFENACSTYPVCVPTRFTFVTGEQAHSRRVPSIDWRMSPAERTIADEFSDAGYHTAYTGKWHLAGMQSYNTDNVDWGRRFNRTPIPPELQGGFDTWKGFELRNGPFDTVYFVDDDPEPKNVPGYQTDGLFDLAVADIEGCERPFFHVISVEPPHPPFAAPEEYERRWTDREVTLRSNVPADVADPSLCEDVRSYYAMIENVDDNVGRLRQFLRTEGLNEETVVVFISDHGELLGSHGLRGKQHPYEESIGIPFIVSGPEIETGEIITDPTCTEDWFPTILGLAGIEPDSEKPGVDLAPLMFGERDRLDRPGVLLEFIADNRSGMPYSDAPWRGFRTERYKYTVRGEPSGAEPWHLFDLEMDPDERHNLIDDPDHEDIARTLHGHLRKRLASSTDTYRLAPVLGHDGLGLP